MEEMVGMTTTNSIFYLDHHQLNFLFGPCGEGGFGGFAILGSANGGNAGNGDNVHPCGNGGVGGFAIGAGSVANGGNGGLVTEETAVQQ
jgi:hypothetical protein